MTGSPERHGPAHHPPWTGGPQLGLRARPRQAGQAGHQGGGHHGPAGAPPNWPRVRPWSRARLGRAPPCSGGVHAGGGLLRGRHGLAHPALRAVRHRGEDQGGPSSGRGQATQWPAGYPSGAQPGRRLRGQGRFVQFLVRDRDSKLPTSFGNVFASTGARVIKCPVRAPRASAFAERWVGTARRECTDHRLILGRCHLEVVLRRYIAHYNTERPHRGLELCPPAPKAMPPLVGPSAVRRADVLGGLLHEYQPAWRLILGAKSCWRSVGPR